ncbi:MAG: hypothetical protein M3O70_14060 [Actinomycetota bacterium]|nr:hypothetical protein [Actinomycetota bacterium]
MEVHQPASLVLGDLDEEAARLGDAPAALSALDRSRAAMARTNGDKRPWTRFLDPARHGSLQIATDVQLGRVNEAARTADTVLVTLDTREEKKRSIALADVASVALHQDDLDRACALATEALAVSRRTETTVGMHRVHQLRRDMQPWNGTRSVRLLDQQLAAASTETTP